MIIDGKKLANSILDQLKIEAEELKHKDIFPKLAVVQIGDNPASNSYIKQKQKAADEVGIILELIKKNEDFSEKELNSLIDKLNFDPEIQGIIIQRPLPAFLNNLLILNKINPKKDVDGFVPNSEFEVPVAKAVFKILEKIYILIQTADNSNIGNIWEWIKEKNIAVVGRGETAGEPIANYFRKQNCATSVITTQTKNPTIILSKADIIISCVGKKQIVNACNIKKGVILISVGIWRDQEGKLHGDYEDDEIVEIASFYTPTPGGVGPVNVACLMKNVILSSESKQS